MQIASACLYQQFIKSPVKTIICQNFQTKLDQMGVKPLGLKGCSAHTSLSSKIYWK
jgi:hypothetical protein